MKKKVEMDMTFCDKCGKQDYVYTCIRCGYEVCYECRKSEMVEYTSGVHFSGSGDGCYCNNCDSILLVNGTDPLYNAYRNIKELKEENESSYLFFKNRSEQAENNISILLGGKKK